MDNWCEWFYWQKYYINNGTTKGPVNGEQYFVEDSVNERLKLKFLPETWFTKSVKNPTKEWWARMNVLYPGDWLYLDEYNSDIKIIHEMNFLNHVCGLHWKSSYVVCDLANCWRNAYDKFPYFTVSQGNFETSMESSLSK